VAGHSHSSGCSIWGDNGQGGTEENFREPLPCNCGALINWWRDKATAAEAEVALLRSRTQPVGEPLAWRYEHDGGKLAPGVWPEKRFAEASAAQDVRAGDAVLVTLIPLYRQQERRKGERRQENDPRRIGRYNFRRHERRVAASPQPASVDVGPSLDEEWEAVRPMLAETQIDAIVEEMVGKFSLFVPANVFATEARLILRRALGTQKGGE